MGTRYKAPDGELLRDPTPEQLANLFRNAKHDYWRGGANAEASIEMDHAESARLPWLHIKSPEPGQFFLTWITDQEGRFSPFDGARGDGLVEDESCGDPFWIPRVCLVSADVAAAVVGHFIQTGQRSDQVKWLEWGELPAYPGFFDDQDWQPQPPTCPFCGQRCTADAQECVICGATWYGGMVDRPMNAWHAVLLMVAGIVAGLTVRWWLAGK